MPAARGYAMPPEWGRHGATWLSWPHNRDTWPTQLGQVQEIWRQMIIALAPHERVNLLVNDQETESAVASQLKGRGAAMSNIVFRRIATVDVWMRDYGPTFVTRNEKSSPLACNDWIFNGWGGKYKDYERDDGIAKEIATLLDVPRFDHPVILEGGSIEVNGAGICMTTSQCLLSPNRNPQLSQGEIEQLLKDTLGVSHVIWLGDGIAGDDTDGHIDDIARFVKATTVVCARTADARDEDYAALEENYERLQSARGANGERLEIVSLPCPSPVAYEGARLPASYANFYIANETVLTPVFGDLADSRALGVLQELFPDRKVIGLPCAEVVAGLGAIHCVTQQEPWAG